ncbi:DUF721 domain-containing protein [Nitriliruptoraceae bacterium ZYF776]|nr:DUF721 domain-containing protein [Profundirhabdus halotolerans]
MSGARRNRRPAQPRDARARDESPPDDTAAARKANAADRDGRLYARKRWQQVQRRAELEREAYDPAPADPDEEWTVADEDGAGLQRTFPPAPVGDAVAALLRRRGWAERLSGATAAQRWHDIVGPELVERCEPVRLAGGALVIRAESQIWATQMRYMLPHLQERANAVLGEGRVREVRLTVGPLQGSDLDRPR